MIIAGIAFFFFLQGGPVLHNSMGNTGSKNAHKCRNAPALSPIIGAEQLSST